MRKIISIALLCASVSAQAATYKDGVFTFTEEEWKVLNNPSDYSQEAAPVTDKSILSETVSFLGTPEAFAACKVADLVTTKIAFNAGAIEGNPIMGAVYAKFGWAGMIGVSALLVYGVYKLHQYYGQQAKPGIAIATALTCGVAGHNLFVN